MSNYRARLFTEQSELLSKTIKLRDFILTDAYTELPSIDQSDLREQLGFMQNYLCVLQRRVNRTLN